MGRGRTRQLRVQAACPQDSRLHVALQGRDDDVRHERFALPLLPWKNPTDLRTIAGSQLWDAAFISQALVETGLGNEPQNQESTTFVPSLPLTFAPADVSQQARPQVARRDADSREPQALQGSLPTPDEGSLAFLDKGTGLHGLRLRGGGYEGCDASPGLAVRSIPSLPWLD